MKTFIIAALTADGLIGKNSSHRSLNWRSKADSDFFISKTREAGIVVMGKNTFETMKRPMPDRVHIVYSHEAIDGVETTKASPAELLADIKKRGFNEVAICGGSSIYTLFMQANLVDTLYLTIEPQLFGSGVPLFTDELDTQLQLISTKQVNDTVLLEYNVVK
tara:strand:- start:197 stop:685 length:489 start_codon:yes stop_codon:yes gene_type:complete